MVQPPTRACSSSWLATTDDSTSVPPITTAAAVSSQLVSMPSTMVDASAIEFPVVAPPNDEAVVADDGAV